MILSKAIEILKTEKEIREMFIRIYGDTLVSADSNRDFSEAVDTVTEFIDRMVRILMRG